MIKRALVADDENAVCGLIHTILADMGFLASVVHTGREAFNLMTTCRTLYDVAIVDVVMPEWDGAETVEMIRGLSVTTPIILISGHVFDSGIAHGVPFLSKPFSPADLRALVNIELEKANA